MIAIRNRGWIWPGFDYTDAEWKRMRALAGAVEPWAFCKFQMATAFLIVVAIGVIVSIGVAGIAQLLPVVYPAWASLASVVMLLVIPLVVFLFFGFGHPTAMRIATALVADKAMRARLMGLPGDAELAVKIARQFRRVAAFISGVFVLIIASELYLPGSMQHWASVVIAIASGVAAVFWL